MKILGKCDRCGKITHLTTPTPNVWWCPKCLYTPHVSKSDEGSYGIDDYWVKSATFLMIKPENIFISRTHRVIDLKTGERKSYTVSDIIHGEAT